MPPCDHAFGRLRALAAELQSLIVQVEDETVLTTLRNILSDTLAQSDELGAMVDSVLSAGTENRRRSRVKAMGEVCLSRPGEDQSLIGHCLDLSVGGVCVSVDRPLQIGERWNLDIRLFGASTSMCIGGRVSWCLRHADSNRHRVGIEFHLEADSDSSAD